MKLEQFVEESLKQIIAGVKRAQAFGEQQGAHVNPVNASFHSGNTNVVYCTDTGIPLQQVEFDVAVAVSESTSATQGGAEELGEITVSKIQTESIEANKSLSRLKFSVPVRLPTSGRQDSESW